MRDIEVDPIRCEQCGLEVEEANRLLGAAYMTVLGLERDMRGKRSRIQELEGENSKALTRQKRYADAVEVLNYWSQHLAPKAREIASPERVKAALARLQSGHTVEGLKLCVDGYARYQYVVDGKRRAKGTPAQRYVKATLIFRDAEHVEAGVAMAKRGKEPEVSPESDDWKRIDWRKVRYANHREILIALKKEYGKPYHDDIARCDYTTCPKCGGGLTVFGPDSSDTLLYCQCGIDEDLFFKALKEDQ